MNCNFLLRSLVSLSVKQSRKSISTTAGCKVPDLHIIDKKGSIYGKRYDKKSKELELWEQSSLIDKVKLEYKLIKKEFKVLKKEMSTAFDMRDYCYNRGEIDVCWRFSDDPECLEQWIVSTDRDYDEGYSEAQLELSPIGTGIFSGNLDTRVPEDGQISHSGFCNIRTLNAVKSFQRETALDWSDYTHLRMRVRGDGRFYWINIGLKQTFDIQWLQMYKYLLMTRGGPYWQDIKIPFSKFFLTYKGRVQDRQQELEKSKVKNLGITLADKKPGPFRLEIDYIGLECDESCQEIFAYESYQMDTLTL